MIVKELLYAVGGEIVSHQFDAAGNHRVVHCCKPLPQKAGLWRPLAAPASVGGYRASAQEGVEGGVFLGTYTPAAA